MAVVEIAKIQVRRGQENITGVPRLDPGEFGWAQDTENLYIGKRIAEGAPDDENTRILTERDLDSIFSLLDIVNTLTLTTLYQYRANVSYINAESVPRLIQTKIDEQNPSLEDFGVEPSIIPTDITAEFQNAVETIFNNGAWDSDQRKDSRRELRLPPGEYLISNRVLLPPYTKIVGAGQELTRLKLVSSTTNIFKTIDADGNDFETNDMRSGVKRAREVHIEGLTLEYDPFNASNNPLLSLDNVLNATVKNCMFRTHITSTSTTTFGLVSDGIGIGIRGTGGGLGSGDVNLCENVRIENCYFDSLYVGVRSTGTVLRPILEKNVLSNLDRGIEMYTVDLLPGPSNGIIDNNRFENIVREAIYVGPNPSNIKSNHVVSQNYFSQVGNGSGLNDFITTNTSATSVINFLSNGNKSVDNTFRRKNIADNTTSTDFYYAPLVQGRLTIIDSETTTATIRAQVLNSIVKIPANGYDQYIMMNYQLYNDVLSRKGTAIINITPDGFPTITDTYNFTETVNSLVPDSLPVIFDVNAFALNKNYVIVTVLNERTDDLTLEYQFNMMY